MRNSAPAPTNSPLSDSLKRVLARGAEATERSKDLLIGAEHMLWGLLKEDCPAARILERFGVTADRVMSGTPGVTRETLSALVASLPEGALERVHSILQRSVRPGMGTIGGGGGGWNIDSAGKVRNGSYSSGRIEDGAQVTETHRFFEGHEITMIERLRMKAGARVLLYSQEIQGPEREHRFEIEFEIE